MVNVKTSFGAFEAKTHFSDLLNRVEHGDHIQITRHGRTVAMLVPAKAAPNKNLVALAQNALRATEGTRLPKGKTVKDLIDAGRTR
jgi:prevent-host-death family protein